MKALLLTLCILAIATTLYAADEKQSDQAFLALLAETKLMRIPGMPKMPDMPAGMKMPDMPNMPGKPERVLNIRLWSPGIAPADATAVITPQDALKQGKKLNLELYRPTSDKDDTPLPKGVKPFDPDSNKKFTIKIYWGSSATVRDGQPKIIKWGDVSPDQKAAMSKRAKEMQAKGYNSYFYKPNWTTGYWPTKTQPGKIAKDASLVGKYTLNTSYTGNVSIEAPSNVEFMDPIEMSSPDLEESVPLDKAIEFKWTAIKNALGLNASIFGMEGEDTMIIWTSAEVFNDSIMGDQGFMQMADVEKNVKKQLFMKGNTTTVTVPIGIFANCKMPMFMMAGYGPGAALEEGQPLPRIQTKTSLNIMLGKMEGMPPADKMDKGDTDKGNTSEGNTGDGNGTVTDDNSGDSGGDTPPPAPSLDDINKLKDAKDKIKNLGGLFKK